MTFDDSVDEEHRLVRIYSERRQQHVLIRISFTVEERDGCQVVQVRKLEELE
jgi:hypothetical protein